MSEPSRSLLACVFACVLVASLAATGAAGSSPSPDRDDRSPRIDDGLADASGTVEVVVRLEEADVPTDADADETADLLEEHADESQGNVLEYAADAAGIEIRNRFWVTNAVLLEVDADRVDLEAFDRFQNVTAIHENFEVSIPDEPESAPASSTDRVERRGYETAPGVADIGAPAVWDAYDTRGEGVTVAVLDTGIDPDHPDLDLYTTDPDDPTYPGGWAEFDDEGNRVEGSTPHDLATHGTHVSGIVAGGDESGRYVGVAPGVDLAHGLVLSEEGGTFARIVAGMEWAIDTDADVISMSLGAPGRYDQFVDPVRNAREHGVVVVAAVGNEGEGTSDSPANVHDAVAVGAIDPDRNVTDFSGGQTLSRANWTEPPEDWPDEYPVPDLVAPGWFVESTVPGGGYAAYPGTSMATPHVSGTVALLLSIDGDLSPDEVETVLYETADRPTNASLPDHRFGHGVVNASAAADAVAPPPVEEREGTASEGEIESPPVAERNPLRLSIATLMTAAVVALLLGARRLRS